MLKLFNRAYDKAARLLPGQESTLTGEEEQILLAVIRAYDQRKARALERFLQFLKKKGVDMPYLHAKMMFKQYWAEGRLQ